MNEREIFLAAIEINDPSDRIAFLDQACAGNTELRAQVEELLQTHVETSQFLEEPAVAAGSVVDQTKLTRPSDDDDPDDECVSGEADFLKFLQPAARPGWLGRLGHYEIELILGRGAFGIVAKAFDEKLHRVVAIKMLSPELASTSPPRKRFLREARTAAAVMHENIVATHAVEEEPIPYLVMEYVPGETLQQRMEQKGPLEMAEILRIGQQVAAGLAAAHAANLIHRDIKPSNILLTGGLNERAKISDFGLARAVDDASLTSSGLIAGTPLYMAPEQARGETLDHRADLFSLGSVLYQMASGRPPFRAANTVAVLKRVCEDTPRSLDDVLPGTPGWLEVIIFRLLEKNRDDRYQTAQEVADLLARCQRELEHNGQVTCVERRSGAAKTQVFPVKKSTGSGPERKPLGWLVGGAAVLGLLGVIAVLITNQNGRPPKITDPVSRGASAPGAVAKPPETPSWQGWPADSPAPAIAPFDAQQAKAHQEAWAKYLNIPVEYTNSIGMKFRLIPPGEFLMGSTPEEIEEVLKYVPPVDPRWKACVERETPPHRVILTQPFYLGQSEVTQAEYQKVMGINPAHFAPRRDETGSGTPRTEIDHPVEMVSWNDSAEFCSRLCEIEQLKPCYFRADELVTPLAGTGYRLPSEAEWEFACRAGSTTRFWFGEQHEDLPRFGWFGGNSAKRTHLTGELDMNPFGLFDILGNVNTWVEDGWDPACYRKRQDSPAVNPRIPFFGSSMRGIRGGGWDSPGIDCRSSTRIGIEATRRFPGIGFRVVLAVDAVRQTVSNAAASGPSPDH